jgi:hypothetical protein
VPFAPCPVKIDFGEVSMNMRNLLRKMGKKSFRPGSAGGDVLPQRHAIRRPSSWCAQS